MDKTKKEELRDILERLNQGEEVEKVKQEAQDLLNEIEPKELSEVEQQLIEEGLPETELRGLCEAHIEAMKEELEDLKLKLSPGHPLHTLIAEHDEILDMLGELEEVNRKIQNMKEYDPDNPVFDKLKDLAHHLIETEKHHEREEETIFPEVDESGITGPTRIMRMEHDDMWPRKEKIEELANNIGNINFTEFKRELKENTEYLVLHLRDHIFKENNILYPTADSVIAENKWEDIKRRCDEIGYCCFTPEV
ncbi:MAG: DUF438 domain-containing protein [Halanaerobiaceae bacterium]